MKTHPSRLTPRYLSADTKGARERNFGLSPEEFAALREELKDGNQRLYEQIFLRHFDDCLSYLRRNDGANREAAYDATMDTLLRFRDLLVADKIHYGNLRYLFTRMARQEYARNTSRAGKTTGLLPELLELSEEEVVFTPEEYDVLSRAFKTLDVACRDLLRGFYFNRQSLKDMAAAKDRPATAVRKQKSRCVATLRRCYQRLSR